MANLDELSPPALRVLLNELQAEHARLKNGGLRLNIARGLPSKGVAEISRDCGRGRVTPRFAAQASRS